MNVQKRGLVSYDDKCILLADLPDNQPNSDTHAFGHYSLEAVRMAEPEQPPAGKYMVVIFRQSRNEQYEARLARKHARDVNKTRALRPDNGDDTEGKLLATSSWWPSERPTRDQVVPSEWATS